MASTIIFDKAELYSVFSIHQYLYAAGNILEVLVQEDLLPIRTDKPQVSATNLKQHCAIMVTMGLKQHSVILNILTLILQTDTDLWISTTETGFLRMTTVGE
jgi:hypothetical protein